jgi:hypothetical protein
MSAAAELVASAAFTNAVTNAARLLLIEWIRAWGIPVLTSPNANVPR